MLVPNAVHDCWKLPIRWFVLLRTVISIAAAADEVHWFASVVPRIVQSTVSAPLVAVDAGSGADPGAEVHPVAIARTARHGVIRIDSPPQEPSSNRDAVSASSAA
jgi:hypothetical protein